MSWLLLLLAASTAVAIQFGDAYINTFVRTDPLTGNKTVTQSQRIPFKCDQGSYRSTSLQVGNYYYDVRCYPPVAQIDTQLAGFVPKRSKLYFSNVYSVDDTTRFSRNDTVIASIGGNSPASRRLLQLVAVGAAIAGAVTSNGGGVNDFICGATMWGVGKDCAHRFGDGNRGMSPETMRALANLTNLMVKWEQNVTQDLQVIRNTEAAIKQQLNLLENQTMLLETVSEQHDAAIHVLATNLETLTNQTHDEIALLSNTTQVALQHLSGELDLFRNLTNLNFNRTAWAMANFSARVADQFTMERGKVRITQKSLRQLATDVYYLATDFLARRVHSQHIADLKAKCRADGLVPYVHPDFPGVDPLESLLTVDEKTILIDTFTINWQNASGSTVVLHQMQISMYCNQQSLVNAEIRQIYWNDIPDLIGLPGCAARAGNTVDNCICWFAVEKHASCNAKLSPPFRWKSITTTGDQSAYTLVASMCQTGAVTTTGNPWNGRKIDDVRVWHDLLGRITDTDFSGGSNIGLDYFQVISILMGVVIVPSVRDSRLVPIDLESLMTTSEFGLTLPFTIYTWMQLDFTHALSASNAYERFIYGTLPNYLTCTKYPNQYLDDGSTYLLDQCEMLCVDPATVPVFRVQQTAIVPLVTAVAYDGPPDCTGPSGCTFAGRHVVSVEQSSTAQPTVPFSGLLPGIGWDVVAGEQLYGQAGTIYDIPKDTNLDPVPQGREGSVTYLAQPVPASFDYLNSDQGQYPPTGLVDSFLELNGGIRPVHSAGSFSLELTVQALETGSNGGRCVGGGETGHTLCPLYSQWRTGADTDFKQGKWTLLPNTFQYDGSIEVVLGAAQQRVVDGCPDVAVKKYTDGTVEFALTNSLPLPLITFARITTVGGVDRASICVLNTGGDVQYDLEPKQTVTITLPACGLQQLEVFALGSTTSGRISCLSQPANVSSDPTSVSSIKRFVLGGVNNTFIENQVAVETAEIARQMNGLLQQAADYLDPTFNPGIVYLDRIKLMNQSFTDWLNKQYSKINLINQLPKTTTTQAVSDALGNSADLLDAVKRLAIQFANKDKELTDLLNQQDAILKQLQDLQNQINDANHAFQTGITHDLTEVSSTTETDCFHSLPFIFQLISPVGQAWCFLKSIMYYVVTFVGIILLCCVCVYVSRWFSTWYAGYKKRRAAEQLAEDRAKREADRAKREADKERREDEKADREEKAAERAEKAAEAAQAGAPKTAGRGTYARMPADDDSDPDIDLPVDVIDDSE